MLDQIRLIAILLALTVVSGIGDSQGYLHAARVWRDGVILWDEVAKSALGFGFGSVVYWIAIRFFQQSGMPFAEVQLMIWFAVTMVGVAALSGEFFRWSLLDQGIALVALSAVGLLMFRTAA